MEKLMLSNIFKSQVSLNLVKYSRSLAEVIMCEFSMSNKLMRLELLYKKKKTTKTSELVAFAQMVLRKN